VKKKETNENYTPKVKQRDTKKTTRAKIRHFILYSQLIYEGILPEGDSYK